MRLLRLAVVVAAVLASAVPVLAQLGGDIPEPADLMKITAAEVRIVPGGSAVASVQIAVRTGWHINANPAANENAIPTVVTITAGHGITAEAPSYPDAKIVRLSFDPEPLLVYDETTVVPVMLRAAPSAAGTVTLAGTVRFQACNDQVCLPPASVPFEVTVAVGAGAATASDTLATAPLVGTSTPPANATGSGFATGPPVGGAAASAARSLDAALARGAVWWFLALFAGGLLLNLTPCVFPMLGVTLSIFGARRQEPLPKVLTNAVLYVLGIAVMYSALGVIAALTGGLFGAALQSMWVSVGLGVLMIVLSLSMFGFYELQPPAWMMDKLGGAASASFAGTFLAGLGVGIIAAPCIGPFVVAVLALIAQKQSVAFGFQTMFTLSLGLGLPYLILATFSNLLQRLPRSGDWMVWVKGWFGMILLGVGAFYGILALWPKMTVWVLPVVLLAAGLYLGWIERTRGRGPQFLWFKRIMGTLVAVAGAIMLTAMPTGGIPFRAAERLALEQALASGRPVLLEFSADWCVPCHELEVATFANRAVVAASRDFHAFKVDLTRYDSPEAETWRRTWEVRGVPTVIFVGRNGQELRALRFEGFMAPKPFIERLKVAASGDAMPASAR